MTKKKENFEEMLKRLQDISDSLENEEIGLDEAILLYEEGVKLARLCTTKLDEAELKITELKKELGAN